LNLAAAESKNPFPPIFPSDVQAGGLANELGPRPRLLFGGLIDFRQEFFVERDVDCAPSH
jgi:hypothetical protein